MTKEELALVLADVGNYAGRAEEATARGDYEWAQEMWRAAYHELERMAANLKLKAYWAGRDVRASAAGEARQGDSK